MDEKELLDRLNTGGAVAEAGDLKDPQLERLLGAVLQDYRVTDFLGRGGMGLLLRGERITGDFEREVAIKVLADSPAASGLTDRFADERRILASLIHPGIAQLYDSGHTPQGWPYLIMELVHGSTVDAYCQDQQLGSKGVAMLVHQIAEAVGYAHSRLVIHRDIKPSNVMVTTTGQSKLLDFGVAKLIAPSTGDTTVGQRPLTPRFASPEQLLGEEITTRSDIYQLGLLLWCLLGHPLPFRRSSMQEAIVEARDEPHLIPAPGTPVSRELQAVVQKCLRAAPEGRYRSVSELQNDLDAYLNGFPVSAVRGNWTYASGRWLGRNRALGATLATALLAAAIGLTAYTRGINAAAERANEQARIAAAQAQKAERIADFLRGIFEVTDPEFANRETTLRELVDDSVLRLRETFAEEPETAIELLLDIGTNYRAQGDHKRADEIFQIAQEISESQLSDGHDLKNEVLERHGRLLGFIDTARGVKKLRQALAHRRAALGDHEKTASVLGSLATTLRGSSGGNQEALALLREADAMYERLGTPDNIDRLAVLFIMAQLLLDQGNGAEALPIFEDNLARQEAINGRKDVRGIILNNIAQAAMLVDDLPRASDAVARSLALFEELHDEPVADTAFSLKLQGRIAQRIGDHQQARASFDRAVNITRQVSGERTLAFADAIRLRAALNLETGQAKAALAEADQAMRLATEIGHERLRLTAGQVLVASLLAVNQPAAAAALANAIYPAARQELGEAHTTTQKIGESLAQARAASGSDGTSRAR